MGLYMGNSWIEAQLIPAIYSMKIVQKSQLKYQIDISCLNTLYICSLFFMNSDTKYELVLFLSCLVKLFALFLK